MAFNYLGHPRGMRMLRNRHAARIQKIRIRKKISHVRKPASFTRMPSFPFPFFAFSPFPASRVSLTPHHTTPPPNTTTTQPQTLPPHYITTRSCLSSRPSPSRATNGRTPSVVPSSLCVRVHTHIHHIPTCLSIYVRGCNAAADVQHFESGGPRIV